MRLNPFTKYETKRVAEEMKMYIGEKLRELRESKALSQGEIEKRTGLLRVYISRVENGHTVPAIETLEKLARALEVPLYHLFYEGEQPPKVLAFPKLRLSDDTEWGNSGTDARYLRKLRRLLARMNDGDRRLLLLITEKMTRTR